MEWLVQCVEEPDCCWYCINQVYRCRFTEWWLWETWGARHGIRASRTCTRCAWLTQNPWLRSCTRRRGSTWRGMWRSCWPRWRGMMTVSCRRERGCSRGDHLFIVHGAVTCTKLPAVSVLLSALHYFEEYFRFPEFCNLVPDSWQDYIYTRYISSTARGSTVWILIV